MKFCVIDVLQALTIVAKISLFGRTLGEPSQKKKNIYVPYRWNVLLGLCHVAIKKKILSNSGACKLYLIRMSEH